MKIKFGFLIGRKIISYRLTTLFDFEFIRRPSKKCRRAYFSKIKMIPPNSVRPSLMKVTFV